MQSGYKIFWTAEALKNLRGILKYLEENWSDKEASKFISKLDKRLKLIALNPKIFSETKAKRRVHRSVLTKQSVIYYLFEDEVVKILTLFDPRQHPSKLKL